jgi:VanZ family protein
LTRIIWLWGPVVLWAGIIFSASAQPDVSLPSGLSDKYTHILAYAPLGVLFFRAIAGGLPVRLTLSTALLGVALTTAYGITDELHQLFVPGRSADWRDVVADAIGGVVAAVVCWLWGIISAAPRKIEGSAPRHGL